jgi:hypothetical protein
MSEWREGKIKAIIPVILSTAPFRRMGEWRNSSNILDLAVEVSEWSL